METSLDEGIGSSGSLSTNNLKNSPSSFDSNPTIKLSPIAAAGRLSIDESTPTARVDSNRMTVTGDNEDTNPWFSYKGEAGGVGLDLDAVKLNYDNRQTENDDVDR